MLQKIINLEGVEKLSRAQQDQVNGQSGCCHDWECFTDADCNDPEQCCSFGECLYFM